MKLTDQTIRGLPLLRQGTGYYQDDTAIAGLAVCIGIAVHQDLYARDPQRGEAQVASPLSQYNLPRFTLALAREKACILLAAERLSKTEFPVDL